MRQQNGAEKLLTNFLQFGKPSGRTRELITKARIRTSNQVQQNKQILGRNPMN